MVWWWKVYKNSGEVIDPRRFRGPSFSHLFQRLRIIADLWLISYMIYQFFSFNFFSPHPQFVNWISLAALILVLLDNNCPKLFLDIIQFWKSTWLQKNSYFYFIVFMNYCLDIMRFEVKTYIVFSFEGFWRIVLKLMFDNDDNIDLTLNTVNLVAVWIGK